MREVILGVLAKGSAHGYELKAAIEGLFGDAWPSINIGQIYTTLGRLERDGLVAGRQVAQANRPDKKVYDLTTEGRTELGDWLRTPSAGPRLRDDLFTKVILAASLGVDDGDLTRLIDRQRRALLQSLRDLHDLAGRQDGENGPAALLIEGAMLHLEADITWLDRCEERLRG